MAKGNVNKVPKKSKGVINPLFSDMNGQIPVVECRI